MKNTHVLLAEPKETVGLLIREKLENHGFDVIWKKTEKEALKAFHKSPTISICVLAVLRPDMDGFSMLKKLRRENLEVPVILLSNLTDPTYHIEGLKLGADDYLNRPFSSEELLWRIKAILRRVQVGIAKSDILKLGPVSLNFNMRRVTIGSQQYKLSDREAELLRFLGKNINKPVEKNHLIQKVLDDNGLYSTRSLDVYISRIRKLLKPVPVLHLVSIRSVGYMLVLDTKDSGDEEDSG